MEASISQGNQASGGSHCRQLMGLQQLAYLCATRSLCRSITAATMSGRTMYVAVLVQHLGVAKDRDTKAA